MHVHVDDGASLRPKRLPGNPEYRGHETED
jgi:hypothetical protein